ncbi:MAG: hypothetical protein ACFFD6_02535 [Candidatus Thorarchaeota archaeon]
MQFDLSYYSMEILGTIPVILLVLLMWWGFVRGSGRTRTLSLLAFLGYLFVAIGWFAMTIPFLGAASISWVVKGIWLYLLAVYCFIWALPDLMNERKWLVIILLILPIFFEVLALQLVFGGWGYFTPGSLTLQKAAIITDAVLLITYMAWFPLYCTIRYVTQDRIKGTARVRWIWLTLIGVLIWFFGEFLEILTAILGIPSSDYLFGIIGLAIIPARIIGWWIMLIGYFFQRRVIQAGES